MIVRVEKQMEKMRAGIERTSRNKTVNLGTKNALAFRDLVAQKVAPTPVDPPTQVTVAVDAIAAKGVTVRIPAGGVAPVEITGLGDWTYLTAHLSVAVTGSKMPLPIALAATSPGKDWAFATHDFNFATPTYINALIGRYGNIAPPFASRITTGGNSLVSIESADELDDFAIPVPGHNNGHGPRYGFVGATVSKLSWAEKIDAKADPSLIAILPNTVEMLSISSDDDRILHQVPHALGLGDVAQSADLAEYFNTSASQDANTALLRLSSRTDCVVTLRLRADRQRQAEGVASGDLPDPLIVSPWAPVTIDPVPSGGALPVVTVTAEARADGAAQVGLREVGPLSMAQRVVLPLRAATLQPFKLPPTAAVARRFSGVWICLPGPPAEPESLQLDIVAYDAVTQTEGASLAAGTAALSNRQMDLVPIGGGVFAHWVPFDAPLEVDTPDLGAQYALMVSTISGPIPLLETAPTVAHLSPALTRDFTRSVRWAKRQFGNINKVLMFELGEIADDVDATLSVTSGAVRQTYSIGSEPHDVVISVPYGGPITLTTDREVSFDTVEVTTQSAVDEIGV